MRKIIQKNQKNTLALDPEEVIDHIINERADYAVFDDERDPCRCDPGVLVFDKSHNTIIMVGVKGLRTYSDQDRTGEIETYIREGVLYQLSAINVK